MSKQNYRNFLLSATTMSAFLCSQSAQAQSPQTGNLGVQITITSECSLGTISGVNFGSVGLLTDAKTQSGTIGVTCTNGTGYTIELNEGLGSGATEAARKMTKEGGTEMISYSLYSDASHVNVWGASPNGYTGTGTGASQPINVYGKVPVQTTPPTGIYKDTVVVTLSY